MTLALRVVSGPAAGTLIPIGGGLVVGRDAPAPGNLSGDSLISRRHAQLRPDGEDHAWLRPICDPDQHGRFNLGFGRQLG